MSATATERAALLRARAARLDEQAAPLVAEFETLRADYTWLTQPADRHEPFARRRQRVIDRYDRGRALQAEAQELRARADRLEHSGAVTAGDREAARQAQRDAADQTIRKGMMIRHHVFGVGTVVRVNRKTYSVEYRPSSGATPYTITIDKSQCQPAE